MYKLVVCGEYSNHGIWVTPVWHNFCNHLRTKNITPTTMELELNKFNATIENIEHNYVGFETEEDATAFVLKWS